ncbi:hypothetical protein BBW65_01560 [Helicobacter enhydrae]|uniref:chorismate mutase n=1 Tax=Helicobacter enhydrae TaxID=222136 RepID=A0A1B1U462_9HELI|nr:chorismate mutase [Helicobacter enhydrae]ANV97574.1 hypothetical protein BBW65_01560 [Helicobacter enhydrae]
MNLTKLRVEIDKIDDEILELLKKRIEIAKQIGILKREQKQEIIDLQRERRIIERLSQDDIFSQAEIASIYQEIFRLTKAYQKGKDEI